MSCFGKPLCPSMQATKISASPRFFKSVKQDSQNLAPRFHAVTSCRSGTASLNRCVDFASRSEEIPKSMVISTLNPSRGYHDLIIVISARESNRKDENSRKKVQNVVTDSTVENVSQICKHSPRVAFCSTKAKESVRRRACRGFTSVQTAILGVAGISRRDEGSPGGGSRRRAIQDNFPAFRSPAMSAGRDRARGPS